MTRRPEDLDELIDRVAAELTAVPSDPALAGRVVARLEGERAAAFGWPRLAAAAAVAAAVIVALLATAVERDAGETQRAVRPASAGGVPEPAVAPPPPIAAALPQVAPASALPRPSATRWITHTRVVPPLDPLSSPELLAIDELSTATLSIAPVAIAPLALASLAADEDEPGDPQE